MLRLFTLEHPEPHKNNSGGGLQKEDKQHCREVVEMKERGNYIKKKAITPILQFLLTLRETASAIFRYFKDLDSQPAQST